MQLTISSGVYPFASSGVFRFLPSATDNRYAIVPVSATVDASTGTYSYSKTSSQSASLSAFDDDLGPLNVTCEFTTALSGTFRITSAILPGPSQSGSFVIFSGSAPASLLGKTLTVTVTSGDSPFADSGAYQFIPDPQGNGYKVVGITGIPNSFGTYSYTQASPTTGVISFNDSVVGSGVTQQMSFDTESSGSAYMRLAGSSGYQTAVFAMSSSIQPPEITAHPRSEVVLVGGAITLTVVATGSSPLSYQWFKNGSPIQFATLSAFALANVQPSDAGSYTVSVSNSAGTVTSSAGVLTIAAPPSIVKSPAGLVVPSGTNITLQVEAAGSLPLGYQWQLDGKEIPGATGAALLIESIRPAQRGRYTVRVFNSAGSVTSSPADVVVWTVATKQPKLFQPVRSELMNSLAAEDLEENAMYRLEGSANFVRWTTISNFIAATNSVRVLDSDVSSARRFFRLVSP